MLVFAINGGELLLVAASSIGMNNYVKKNSGNLYDGILKWISTL
jgi:hypothetical protein